MITRNRPSAYLLGQHSGVNDLVALSRRQRGRVIGLLPAHNEAAAIAYAIQSLRAQSRPPDLIVVVCDNCTDSTGGLSLLHGVTVFHTSGNAARKAGALNQALRWLLPQLRRDDLILIMDADSLLSPDWIRNAESCLLSGSHIGAVCGVVKGIRGLGLLGQLQRNEYARGTRVTGRRRGVRVLSGCGTIFRAHALRSVASSRGVKLPGTPGDCFNESSITEDYEMTLALRSLGYGAACSLGSVATTELMPTWRELFRQRVRWQQGALNDLRHYRLTKATRLDWSRQGFGYLTYGISVLCWMVILWSIAQGGHFDLRWGLTVVGLSLTERIWTVRRAGLPGMLVAALLVPELCYGLYEAFYLFWAAFVEMSGGKTTWNHLGQSAV